MRVAALVPDLFFMTKIAATAQGLGIAVRELKADTALEACRSDPPDLLLVDLHGAGDPVDLVRALKRDDRSRGVRIVAFHSHVDRALHERAVEAGADRVLPRSAFSVTLPEILSGGPGPAPRFP